MCSPLRSSKASKTVSSHSLTNSHGVKTGTNSTNRADRAMTGDGIGPWPTVRLLTLGTHPSADVDPDPHQRDENDQHKHEGGAELDRVDKRKLAAT